ncbi:uncharacterized protein PAC_16300 [Phialocephala subalpina]|uniref:Uncharacterized protein n=1 Tax=Phialocephala subalpina TaxID=576137 RepID=A0A1L7XMY5_9HELO|nr:uncharacterized protein PAC_16300 [Phialocephala subalpina]
MPDPNAGGPLEDQVSLAPGSFFPSTGTFFTHPIEICKPHQAINQTVSSPGLNDRVNMRCTLQDAEDSGSEDDEGIPNNDVVIRPDEYQQQVRHSLEVVANEDILKEIEVQQ